MSRLHVTQIAGRFREAIRPDLELLGEIDGLADEAVWSRCLAAHAIYMATGCSPVEAAIAVWDGTGDNGIDAAYYDPNKKRVVLVQSKWIISGSGEPAARDVASFVKGAYDLIEASQANFDARLTGRVSDIINRLQEPGTEIYLYVVSTGASTLSQPAKQHLDDFVRDVNDGMLEPLAGMAVFGLREVYASIASPANEGDVELQCQLFHYHFVRTPYPAYFGMVDGLTIRSWWQNNGGRLLATNIRHSLGSTDVNTEIRQTATDEPEKFWYYNNGITIIATDTLQAPAAGATREAGIFRLRGASIVNGAQTVSTLGAIEDETALGRTWVSVRVILLNQAPPDFAAAVTRTNNLQNRIEARDFVAQDQQQHRLRQELAMEDIEYQYVRSGDFVSSPNSCDLIEVTTALACATGAPNMAVQVKTGLGRFFNDLSRPPYLAIFNPATTGSRAFNATLALRAIELWIETKKATYVRKAGQSWGALVHGNRLMASLAFAARLGTLIDVPVRDFLLQTPHEGEAFEELMEETHSSVVNELMRNYENRHLAILFKNPSQTAAVHAVALDDLKGKQFLFYP
ncbi:AIPR family protein [Lysobacter sp. ESA13C]|uniref:AIPR family protein n=1 Tax=Lysobacter sp. ESA13C TaxID=2862676 RepID=UPI001CC0000F|nr:AIPR family protein [Lysobacter sp. ESA13C]